jgi:hypothetical protein
LTNKERIGTFKRQNRNSKAEKDLKIDEKLKKLLLHNIFEFWKENVLNGVKHLQQDIDENSGILCLYENYDTIRTWSHYTNGHMGKIPSLKKKP